MEMHQVRYFLAMSRLLNFTRAADECNVSQPSLTRAIQKLEDELGGPLFRRERSRTHLTDLGRLMLPHLERTFEGAQAAKALALGVGKAQVAALSLGVATGVESDALDAVLADLGANLLGFELTVQSGTSDQLIELALNGALDLLIVEAPDDAPDRFEAWQLYAQAYRMIVRSAHPFAGRDSLTLAEVEQEPWIDCGGDGFARARRAADAAGLSLNVRHRATDSRQLLRLILAGLGCAYMPKPRDDDRLASLHLIDVADTRGIVLAAIGGRKRSVAADAFVRAARARDWADSLAD
jgi:DNA-binding transcriptional LysR family regulator